METVQTRGGQELGDGRRDVQAEHGGFPGR